MELDFDLTIRLATSSDQSLFDRVAPDVFDGEIIQQRLLQNLNDPQHHLAIALSKSTIVGMAAGVCYVQPDKDPQFFIDELGVTPSYQRRGIARRLLELLFEHARRLGCKEAWVAADEDNEPARALYASMSGSQESRAIIYTFSLPADGRE